MKFTKLCLLNKHFYTLFYWMDKNNHYYLLSQLHLITTTLFDRSVSYSFFTTFIRLNRFIAQFLGINMIVADFEIVFQVIITSTRPLYS